MLADLVPAHANALQAGLPTPLGQALEGRPALHL